MTTQGQHRLDDEQPETDLIDAIPVVGRATTQLERSFGPSCLLSLVIVLLLVMVLKRFMQIGWGALVCLLIFVWLGVLTLLVRWRPDRVIDED
jgi:hypothetical protein